MISIKDNLLLREVINSEKQVLLRCKETSIATCEQEIAVWWKRAWHWINTKHVGDGMQIVRVHERPFILFDLSVDWMIKWMSLFQEYDEHADETITYLYRFWSDEDKIDSLNNVLSNYTDEYRVSQEGKFVILSWTSILFPDQQALLRELTSEGMSAITSFIFGILLVYGSWDQEDDTLHGARIQLPLVWSIAGFQKVLEQVRDALIADGIYTVVDLLGQKYGQLWQMSIGDGELLKIFAQYLQRGEASKWQTLQEQKKSLLARLHYESLGEKILETIDYSVLKLIGR